MRRTGRRRTTLGWADLSISMNRNFTNLRTKALVLAKKGDAAGSETLVTRMRCA